MAPSDTSVFEKWTENQDADAFAEIVSRHSAMVYGTCKRILKNASDAEDVAQECFIELAQGRTHIKHSLGGWLHTIAVHRSLNRVKAENRRKKREARYAEGSTSVTEPSWDDVRPCIDEAIAQLPEKLRQPIIYRFMEGHTHQAIAEELSISRSTVQYRLNKGIDAIRKALKKRGIQVATSILVTMMGANLAEAVPVTLTATLGTIALAGTYAAGAGTAGATATGITVLGGLFVMKKVIVGGLFVLVAAMGLWTVTQRNQLKKAGGPTKSIHITQESESRSPEETSIPPYPLAAVDEAVSAGLPESVSETTPESEAAVPTQGRVLSGRVEDNNGAPVGGAEVIIGGGSGSTHISDSIESGVDGFFEFTGVASIGKIWLTAKKDGLAGEHLGPLDLTFEGLTGVIVPMFPEGIISGKLVDSSGAPWPNVSIVAELDPDSPEFTGYSSLTHAYTDSTTSGEFMLTGLTPGAYGFVVDYQPALFWGEEERAVITLKAGEHARDITLTIVERELTIRGYVYDTADRPIQDAEVHYEAGHITRRVSTDETGYYETIPLTEGRTSIDVSHPMYRSARLQPVYPGSTNVDFVLEAYATVSGRVVDSQTRKAVPVFEIAFAEGLIEEITTFTFRKTEETHNEEGLFLIEKVVSGDVTLAVRSSGYAIALQPILVPPGESVEGILIRLQPATGIKGIVTDVSGNVIADARVFYGLVPHESWHTKHTAAVTGADGTFVLDSIPATGQLLSAYHRDYSIGSTRVRPDSDDAQPVTIVLEQGGSIEGMITMNGEPLTNNRVSVLYFEYFYSPHHYCNTNQDGQYSLSSLTPGEVSVCLSISYGEDRSGLRRLYSSAIVKDGETRVVDFDASSYNGILEGTVSVDGEGIMGAVVTAHIEANGLLETNRSFTRQNGSYRLEQLPPGPATLEVTTTLDDGQKIESTLAVHISEDEVIHQDVDLEY